MESHKQWCPWCKCFYEPAARCPKCIEKEEESRVKFIEDRGSINNKEINKLKIFNVVMLMVVILIFMSFVFKISCDYNRKRDQVIISNPLPATTTIIDNYKSDVSIKYNIVEQWSVGVKGVGMRIVVDPNASKEDVMRLANNLKNEYHVNDQVEINIFDSEMAARNQTNSLYPEKELFSHYLVSIRINRATGFSRIAWMASK